MTKCDMDKGPCACGAWHQSENDRPDRKFGFGEKVTLSSLSLWSVFLSPEGEVMRVTGQTEDFTHVHLMEAFLHPGRDVPNTWIVTVIKHL